MMNGDTQLKDLRSLDIVLVDSLRMEGVTLTYRDNTSVNMPAIVVAQDLGSGMYLTWGVGREKIELLASAYNWILKTHGRIGLFSDRQSRLISSIAEKQVLDRPMIELRRAAGTISKGVWSEEALTQQIGTHFQMLNEHKDGEHSPKRIFEMRVR